MGKTTLCTWFAGIYSGMDYKVLVVDADFYTGGVACSLNLKVKKDIYDLHDNLSIVGKNLNVSIDNANEVMKSTIDYYKICEKLEKLGVIDDAKELDEYLCENGYASNIRPGVYQLKKGTDY